MRSIYLGNLLQFPGTQLFYLWIKQLFYLWNGYNNVYLVISNEAIMGI